MNRKLFSKKITKIAFCTLVLAVLIIPQTGCGDKEPVSGSDTYLDTQCDITIYDKSEDEAKELITGAFAVIAEQEQLLSKTIEGSDVDRANRADGAAVKISEDTADVIKLGIEMGRISDGDFDITIGRLTDLWDFKSEHPEVPEASAIDDAIGTVDFHQISLSDSKITLGDQDAKLDLGGIAKGYVADKTAQYLEDQGVESAIVNLGGNVVAIGSKPDGQAFAVGVERPYSDRTEIAGVVQASDQTIVTSGIYERKFEQDGVLYHHIIDPRTGYPAETDLEAVTIIADKGNSAFCDGLSTTCLMKGAEGARKLIGQMQKEHPEMHIEAAFIDKNDTMTKTDGMEISEP